MYSPENSDEQKANNLILGLKDFFKHLRELWGRIGIGEAQQDQRVDVVIQHVNALLSEMEKEEVQLEERLLKNIEAYLMEKHALCQELGFTFEKPQDLSILRMEKELSTSVNELLQIKKTRIDSLLDLQQKEKNLCDSMLMTSYYISINSVPRPEELEEYRKYVTGLFEEKLLRHEQYESFKEQIVGLLNDLESCPNTSFERDVICEDESSFVLSTENLDAMKNWKIALEEKKTANNIVANSLRDRLVTLWDKLMVDQFDRDVRLLQLSGQKPSTIQALHNEIVQCEQLKKERTKELILSMRQELIKWWDVCKYGKSQKNLSVLSDETFTEEVLEKLYAEIEKLKQFYEECKEIFVKVEKRNNFWNHKLDLEARCNDHNRYNNRGGTLLQEEKERKKNQKELTKIEKELELEIIEWENKNSRPFRIQGRRFLEFVTTQKGEYEKQKELEKEERQKAKVKQRENEMLHGSRLVKRKLPSTPTKTPTKFLKLNGSGAITPRSDKRGILTPLKIQHSSLAAYNSPKSCLPPKKPSTLKYQNKRVPKMSNLENNGTELQNASVASVASSITSYADFSNALNQHHREYNRSSLICTKGSKPPSGMKHMMF